MIDIHSHIISSIDDGAKDEKMSLKMIERAYKSGTRKIVATPHYIYGRYDVEISKVKEKVEELRKLAKTIGDIEIYAGQEIYYSSNLLEYYKAGAIGTINDSDYMMIELPIDISNIREVQETIYELQIRGIKPIIAHPERYNIFMEKPERINELMDEEYLFQLNVGSLAGKFGKKTKKLAKLFLDKEIYNFIGSDAHRDEMRNTDMRIVLEEIESDYLNFINESSSKMLENKEIIFKGEKVIKRGFWNKIIKNCK